MIRPPEKNREYQRAWYAKNRKKQMAKTKANRKRLQAALNQYKAEKGCVICSETDPVVLVFHHKNPGRKKFTVAKAVLKGIALDRLLEEAEKCDVLCANCHLRIHYGPRPVR